MYTLFLCSCSALLICSQLHAIQNAIAGLQSMLHSPFQNVVMNLGCVRLTVFRNENKGNGC